MFRRMLLTHLGVLLSIAAATTVAHATTPEVVIDGFTGGGDRMTFTGGAVQFAGIASDPHGIKAINARFKYARSENYLSPQGKFTKTQIRIPIQFKKNASRTAWKSLSYKVPAGKYLLLLDVEDTKGNRSKALKVPVTVTAAAAVAATTAATPNSGNARAPQVAINFPQNGGVVKGRAVFSGVANDDGNVSRVVATVMNADNGLFLSPNGRFGQRVELALKNTGGSNAQWSSPPIELPPGTYVLAVRGADNDGKLSGWTQSKFKIVAAAASVAEAEAAPAAITATNTATAGAVAATGGTASNGMPFCSNASQDADGDGFGWENKGSCVIQGSKADTHPNCASAESDPDGDGFGWENEKSCTVVVHCSANDSDPDGDGFGWENDKSCVVLQTNGRFPRCASAASDPDGDGYGWENSKTCLMN